MAGKEGGAIDKHEQLTDSYFKNPGAYQKLAYERGVSVMELLESRIPPKERSKLGASVVEVMMWHRHKVDLIGRGYSGSSPINKVGNFTNDQFNKTDDAKLFWEFNEDSYCRTLQTGASPQELASAPAVGRNPESTERLSTISGLQQQTAENPYDEQPMTLSRKWEPQIDYQRIVASVKNTSRTIVRIPYNTTEEGDPEEMDVTPEGVAPLVVELGYDRETLDFTGYGATIIATDEYLLDNQTTAEAIREEVMKLGMRRREALFHSLIVLAAKSVPTSNRYYLGGDDQGCSAEKWNQFRKVYENYAMNIMLGNNESVSEWEDMYFGVDTAKTITMDFFARRGSGSNPSVLNNQPSIPDYGWVNREKTVYNSDDVTIAGVQLISADGARFIVTWDRGYGLKVWFRRGLTQDEMERVPGERKMRRHLHTDVGFIAPVDGLPSFYLGYWGRSDADA